MRKIGIAGMLAAGVALCALRVAAEPPAVAPPLPTAPDAGLAIEPPPFVPAPPAVIPDAAPEGEAVAAAIEIEAAPVEVTSIPIRAAARPPAPPSVRTTARGGGTDLGLQIGAGMVDFAAGAVTRAAATGVGWDVRLVASPRRLFGMEAAYVGSAHALTVPGSGEQGLLIASGLEGALRMNLPLGAGRSFVVPFWLLGFGLARFTVVDAEVEGTGVARADQVVTVPVGLGLALGRGAFFLDARLTYRLTFGDRLFAAQREDGALRHFNVGGSLGVGF